MVHISLPDLNNYDDPFIEVRDSARRKPLGAVDLTSFRSKAPPKRGRNAIIVETPKKVQVQKSKNTANTVTPSTPALREVSDKQVATLKKQLQQANATIKELGSDKKKLRKCESELARLSALVKSRPGSSKETPIVSEEKFKLLIQEAVSNSSTSTQFQSTIHVDDVVKASASAAASAATSVASLAMEKNYQFLYEQSLKRENEAAESRKHEKEAAKEAAEAAVIVYEKAQQSLVKLQEPESKRQFNLQVMDKLAQLSSDQMDRAPLFLAPL
jgi:hypothetical protein